MKMVMLDLETLGVNPGSVILSVGAVRFDSVKTGEWFYARIDLRDSMEAGFRVEPDTLMWWFRHGEASVDHAALGGERVFDALSRFALWLGKEPFELWGNGSTFDNDILRGAFRRMGLRVWERRADRCFRTLCDPLGGGILRDFNALLPLLDPPEGWLSFPRHHALRDAACQAAYAVKVFDRLGLGV